MMEHNPNVRLLRIFLGESDRHGHQPLYEALVYEAKRQGLSGATVLRGIMGYGADSRVQVSKLIEISSDMTLVIEIVDTEEKIRGYLNSVKPWFEQAHSGGLITLEKAEVIRYRPGRPG
jgi:PII-like signaling protein